MTLRSLADGLIKHLADLDGRVRSRFDLPLEKQLKMCFLDYLGVTLFGSTVQADTVNRMRRWLGMGDSLVLGTDIKCSALDAAFLMAFQAHSVELDDGHRKGMVHPGSVVFSSILAVASLVHPTWELFSRAAIIGYETTILLAESVQPMHKEAGFHATATCGAAGAAIAVSVLLDLPPRDWKNALSIALSGANGLLETINKESELKPVNAARAAMLGVNAAYLASCGVRGPYDIIGGERGFASCMAASGDGRISSIPADSPCIMNVYFKPYSSCRHCHSGVEAAIRISNNSQFSFRDVRCVRVETYQLAIKGHVEKDVKSIAAAKMSIPVSVTLALATGRGDLFDDVLLNDVEIRRVISATEVIARDDLSILVPEKRVAIVTVKMKDGSCISERIEYPKGEPENPMTEEEIRAKFMGLSTCSRLSNEDAAALFEDVRNISEGDSLETILAACRID